MTKGSSSEPSWQSETLSWVAFIGTHRELSLQRKVSEEERIKGRGTTNWADRRMSRRGQKEAGCSRSVASRHSPTRTDPEPRNCFCLNCNLEDEAQEGADPTLSEAGRPPRGGYTWTRSVGGDS